MNFGRVGAIGPLYGIIVFLWGVGLWGLYVLTGGWSLSLAGFAFAVGLLGLSVLAMSTIGWIRKVGAKPL